jgi:hypothetical protein
METLGHHTGGISLLTTVPVIVSRLEHLRKRRPEGGVLMDKTGSLKSQSVLLS